MVVIVDYGHGKYDVFGLQITNSSDPEFWADSSDQEFCVDSTNPEFCVDSNEPEF